MIIIAILKIAILLSLLILAAKGPSKTKVKYKRPDEAGMSNQYAVNQDGEIEELLNKTRKKEDY